MSGEYRYTECGLDNVVIEGLDVHVGDDGEETYRIPNVMELHRAIAHAVLTHSSGMGPAELRFIRSEIGMTQAELARVLKVEPITVGRWERGENPMDNNTEVVVRLLAAERLSVDLEITIEDMAERCVWSSEMQNIRIDGHDPDNYRPLAA